MTYAGRLELHLRHLKLKRESPYADEFKDYIEPKEKPVEKSVEDQALDKIADKVAGKVVDLKPEKEVVKPKKKEDKK